MEKGKSPFDICGRCGKRRHEVGVLIPYKGKYICDQCVIQQNKMALKMLKMEQDKDEEVILEEEEENELDLDDFAPVRFDIEKIEERLKKKQEVPWIEDLSKVEIDPKAVSLVPRAIAEQYCLIPIRMEGKNLVVAFSDPDDEEALQELKYFLDVKSLNISIAGADAMEIEEAIEKYYKDDL